MFNDNVSPATCAIVLPSVFPLCLNHTHILRGELLWIYSIYSQILVSCLFQPHLYSLVELCFPHNSILVRFGSRHILHFTVLCKNHACG